MENKNGKNESLASDGPVTKSEGTDAADLNGEGGGDISQSGTNQARDGGVYTEADATEIGMEENDAAKGYDGDEEEMETGSEDEE